MFVYSRTAQGQAAAYGDDSALPRKLRSLLRVIDGNTSLDTYVRNLRAFGDVEKILISLEKAGMLQHVSEGGAEATRPDPQATVGPASLRFPASSPVAAAPSLRTKKSWSLRAAIGLKPAAGASDSRSSDSSVPQDTLVADTIAQTPTAFRGFRPTQLRRDSGEEASGHGLVLRQAVEEMSTFVLTKSPEQALAVLRELEQVHSFEELAVIMGGYAQIIAHCGDDGKRHLARISQLIGRFI
jgi:hypothetical protein